MKRFLLATLLTTAFQGIGIVDVSAQGAPPSFKNLVAVGDSLTAGMQSNSLNSKGQNNAFPAFFARQVGTFLFSPLISSPGIPNELILVDPGPPPVLVPAEGPSGTRVLPTIVPQNLAVPGQKTLEALTIKPDLPLDSLADLILGLPSLVIPQLGIPALSQVEMAYVLNPTFTLFWLGPDDAFRTVFSAGTADLTPIPVFTQAYQQAVGTILATGSKVIVGNIPDPTVIPFLSSAEEVAALVGAPLPAIGPLLGIGAGDYVSGLGLPMLQLILTGQMPGPLPPQVVLTAAEVGEIRVAVATMNGFINQFAAAVGLPVVDLYSALNELEQDGITIGTVHFTTSFLGGIFSLDGVHPTNTGQAFIANRFIQKVNEFYGLNIPLVDLAEVASQDPLNPSRFLPASSGAPPLMSVDFADQDQLFPHWRAGREETESGFDSGQDPSPGRELVPLEPEFGDGYEIPTGPLPSIRLFPGPARPSVPLWRFGAGKRVMKSGR